MAGDWMKMEHSLPDKPEVLAISGAMGIEPDTVVGKCFRVWRWFDQHTKDGHARSVTSVTLLSVIGHGHGNDIFLKELVKVGWLIEDETGLTIPNFDRHNGETAKTRGLATKRKQKQRTSSHEEVTEMSRNERDKSATREEKRRDIKEGENPPPDPDGSAFDPRAFIFSQGVALLVEQGESEKTARSFLGQYATASKQAKLVEVLNRALQDPPLEAKSYIVAAMAPKKRELVL